MRPIGECWRRPSLWLTRAPPTPRRACSSSSGITRRHATPSPPLSLPPRPVPPGNLLSTGSMPRYGASSLPPAAGLRQVALLLLSLAPRGRRGAKSRLCPLAAPRADAMLRCTGSGAVLAAIVSGSGLGFMGCRVADLRRGWGRVRGALCRRAVPHTGLSPRDVLASTSGPL